MMEPLGDLLTGYNVRPLAAIPLAICCLMVPESIPWSMTGRCQLYPVAVPPGQTSTM